MKSSSGTSLRKVFNPDLKHSTLIIPSVWIGNVPQLAIDLLIHTHNLEKVDSLDDLYLYPFASPVDYVTEPKKGISHAAEVFHNKDLNLTLIQQRSPILPYNTKLYVTNIIIPFITSHEFDRILILDSLDAGLVEHISSGGIELYTKEDLLSESLESMKLNKEESTTAAHEDNRNSKYVRCLLENFNLSNDSNESHSNEFKDVVIDLLVSYVYEGDNFYDGENLANKVNSVLLLPAVQKWVRPVSWAGVYGDKPVPNAMEQGLYGWRVINISSCLFSFSTLLFYYTSVFLDNLNTFEYQRLIIQIFVKSK